MALLNLEDQLVFYRSYHFNRINVAIHMICIPQILLSAIAFMIPWKFGVEPMFNYGVVLAWVYSIFYVLLDWKLGIPTMAGLVGFSHYLTHYYFNIDDQCMLTSKEYLLYSYSIHFICWIAQIIGHQYFEQRAPAFIDNVLQALVLAPFFVVYEVAFWAGYRSDLKKRMDNRAGMNVYEFRKTHPKKVHHKTL